MRKKGSLGNYTISELCFVVYPVSLQLQNQPSSKLYFYFEKNLQIISKIQAPDTSTQPKGVLHFSCPIYIQHFRTQSDKSLDYQWSLYMGDDQQEQLVETQKINLERVSAEYQQRKQPVYTNTISFNRFKCKLTYLITIGNSNEAALDNVKVYFKSIGVSPLTDEVREQLSKQAQNKREEVPAEINSPSPIKTDGGKEQNNISMVQSKTEEVFSSPSRVPETEQVQESKEGGQINNGLAVNQDLLIVEQPVLQLTPSQQEIGNALEIDVTSGVETVQDKVSKEVQTVLPTLSIKRTETQLLPSSSFINRKYAVIILIVLVLLAGSVLVGRRPDILSSLQKSWQKVGKKTKHKAKK